MYSQKENRKKKNKNQKKNSKKKKSVALVVQNSSRFYVDYWFEFNLIFFCIKYFVIANVEYE